MEECFRRFCHYYIVDEDEKVLEDLKSETKDEFKEINKKAIKYVKNLRRKAGKLGFGVDFESFCNCLEEYINRKDGLTDEEKKSYLKVLMSLSQIYEINLREELERYVSVRVVDAYYDEDDDIQDVNVEESRLLFKKLCLCTLNKDKEELLKVKEEIINNAINYEEMEVKAISLVKEIKALTEKLGFGTTTKDFYKMVERYIDHKKDMSYEQKVVYLKILMYLSSIYDVNLRELLENSRSKLKIEKFIDMFDNPLNNNELINALLEQRYHNGCFEIDNLVLASDLMIKNNEEYDYVKLQIHLANRLIQVFLTKFNDYCYDDLKQEFLELVSEEDITILKRLTERKLYNIYLEIKKGEASRYIVKKYKLSDNIYKFIYLIVMEVVNLKQEYVGKITMFNSSRKKNNIGIFINGPEKELLQLISEYIMKCVNLGLSYDLKGITDRLLVIFYTTEEDLDSRLKILDEIKEEYPEIVNSMGSPLHMTGRMNESYYGISSIKKDVSYIIYMNDLLEVAYYRVLAKLVGVKIDDQKASLIIENFISLSNVKSQGNLPSTYQYGDVDFGVIKDIINQYIPYVVGTLNIYMEDKNRKEEIALEFRKSIRYISNVTCGKPKKENTNIIFNLL